jgi:hypothetical protein
LAYEPFNVMLFSEFQIKKYVEMRRQVAQVFTLHLDMSPNVVKLPNTNQDKPAYYSLVCSNMMPHMNMSIADCLTTDSTQASVTNFLLTFKRSVAKVSQSEAHMLPNFIVVDYSAIMINSALLSFNGENIVQYVNKIFVIYVLQQAYYNSKPFTCLLVCQDTFLDIFYKSLKVKVKDRELRKFTRNCMRLLINSPVMEDVKYFYQAIFYMLNSTVRDARYNYYHELIMNNIPMTYDVAEAAGEDKDEGLKHDFFSDDMWAEGYGSTRDESKFTKLFADFLVSVPVSESGIYLEKNPFYCPAAFKAIEFHMHLFPLFSRIVVRSGWDVKRTNAPVVDWFGFVKSTLLVKRLFRRPYEFIKILNQHVCNKFRESNATTN